MYAFLLTKLKERVKQLGSQWNRHSGHHLSFDFDTTKLGNTVYTYLVLGGGVRCVGRQLHPFDKDASPSIQPIVPLSSVDVYPP